MPDRQIAQYLSAHNIRYISHQHEPTFTSQELAATIHHSGHCVAKTVIINQDGTLAMAVLPACERIDLRQLQEHTNAQWVSIAQEHEFEQRFPHCEIGGMPPFGNLYKMPVYASSTLAHEPVICFNAGSHTEIIQMAFSDYERLVSPQIFSFTLMH